MRAVSALLNELGAAFDEGQRQGISQAEGLEALVALISCRTFAFTLKQADVCREGLSFRLVRPCLGRPMAFKSLPCRSE